MANKRHPRYDAELRKELKRLYRQHGSIRAVAEALDISHSRVWRLLHEQGVDTSRASDAHKRRRARKRKEKK